MTLASSTEVVHCWRRLSLMAKYLLQVLFNFLNVGRILYILLNDWHVLVYIMLLGK